MCGIIAYTGKQRATPILLDGLRRLEYRGYDSAGVAVLSRKKIKCTKAAGKLSVLESQLPLDTPGQCGIGHTRWATHGAPTDLNAHPHLGQQDKIAVVHNGIIENADTLREYLIEQGISITSDTDTEVLAHLIELEHNAGTLVDAVRVVLNQVQGTYGLAVIDRDEPQTVVVARNGSPVILGLADGEMLAGSDMSALLRYTSTVVHLDDGEIAELKPSGFKVTTLDASTSSKQSITLTTPLQEYDKAGHEHFLHREILDQPDTVRSTVSGRLDHRFSTAKLGGLNLDARELLNVKRIKILGCGSALYAGMAGAHMIESLARIAADAESAAEFRYRNPVIEPNILYIVVSQSGETFDTLAAVREIQRKGGFVLGVVNSVGSTIAREVDGGVYMHAGPEVSVASTKAYTSMLMVFSLLALTLGRIKDMSPQHGARILQAMDALPDQIQQVLQQDEHIKSIAAHCSTATSAFFIGRTIAYPMALEGAQKLKEISYIHAEAYPASELKHGPLALVTQDTPCVVILPDTDLLAKSLSSLEEIKARGAPVIAITDSADPRIQSLAEHTVQLPATDALLKPIVMGVALQLLAYHCAVTLGRDVDQPRNLAKSVTVE
ncbi:MAG: glutamine--fructose-6-phosphate transaminase (isomerizing) [Gammaproteobacteria bacterium]|nr:glutamine--fructose-6-phosphate transaminase (isomerizing) [Gammaproteobacteria bacterium]